ncbi:MAG: PilZ domain-containing protein [Acidobacteriota bacterium]
MAGVGERRRVARITPAQPVEAKVKTSLPARILDISSRGAQLEVANCLKPNVICELRLHLIDGEVTVRALVRRCRAWGFGLDEREQRVLLYRAGVEFSEMAPEVLTRLRAQFALPESGEHLKVVAATAQPARAVTQPSVEKADRAEQARPVAPAPAVTTALDATPVGDVVEPPAHREATPAPAAPPPAKLEAPRRDGPVKIRIRSDHVRKILDEGGR